MSANTPGNTNWTPERMAALSKTLVFIVIVGVLGGVFAVYANLYYVAAAAGVICITVLAVWKFEAVLLVYVLIAFLPWGRTPDLATGGSGEGKGVYTSEAILVFILGIWLIRVILRAVPKVTLRSGFDIPIILYTAYSVLCLSNGFIFWDSNVDRMYQYPSVNIIELGFRLLSAGAFVMMATSLSDAKWLKRIAVIAMVPGLFNLINLYTGYRIPVIAPWWPILAFLPTCYFCALALDKDTKVLHRALSATAVFAIVFVVLVISVSWISGWLGLCASLAAVIFIKNKKLFLVVIVMVAIVVMAAQPFIQKNVFEVSAKEGDYDRFALMKGALRYAVTFPLGVGPGNYRTYNSFYYGEKWGTTAYTSAHGTYSQHLAEMGIPGLILFLMIPGCGGLWLLKNYRRMPDGFPRTFVLAAMGQMAGICASASIGDYIIPTYHNGGLTNFSSTVYSWIIWGIAVALVGIERMPTEFTPTFMDVQPDCESSVPAVGVKHIQCEDQC